MDERACTRLDNCAPTPHVSARKRVLVIDDHEVVREGMRRLIDATTDLCVCAEAADVSEARRAIEELHPDLAVIDLSLGQGNGIELVKWIKLHHPAVRSIVASMHDEKFYGVRALRAGARGYVTKSQPACAIIDAIRHVLTGELYFSKELIDNILRRTAHKDEPQMSAIDLLSDRELEVFRRIGLGLKSQEIAQALHLSISTIDTYRERLKAKLGVTHSAELAYRAARWTLENP